MQRANTLGVNLLVSIHHNDVQDRDKEKWRHAGESRVYSDRFAGHSLFVFRASRKPAESLAFGHLLGIEWKAQDLAYTRHHLEDMAGQRPHEPGANLSGAAPNCGGNIRPRRG